MGPLAGQGGRDTMTPMGNGRKFCQIASLVLSAAALYGMAAAGCTLPRSGELDQNCTAAEDCDDDTVCTDDVCGDDGFCLHTPVDNSGSVIQVPFDCKSISCEAGRPVATADDRDLPTNPCVDASCNNGTLSEVAKAEGADCTLGQGTGECAMGECIVKDCAANQAICDDDNGCTTDACDQQQDECTHANLDNEPSASDVPNDCRVKLCVMGVEQELNDNNDLFDDGNPCTTDTCFDGGPVHTDLPQGTVCGNSNGRDLVCNDMGECVGCNQPTDCAGTDTTCQWRTCDNEICDVGRAPSGTFVQNTGLCTELHCDGSGGTMPANKTQGTNCIDGLYCTTASTCNNNGNCVGTGNPCPGADGDGDCSETCNENSDNCAGNDANLSVCNDGDPCNGTDQCNNGGACSVHSGNPCASTQNVGPGCNDSCNPANGNCDFPDINTTTCSDGTHCNGAETCNGSGTCVSPGNPCPGHDVGPGCADSCNEGSNNCSANDANTTSCDNGDFCDGVDTCNGGGTCVSAGNPCASTHNVGPGCNDSCNPANGSCNFPDINATTCSDGTYCNGAETCNGSGACVSPGNPCPGDDVGPVCDDSCDEGAGDCGEDDQNCSGCCNYMSMGAGSGDCNNGNCDP
jgi:hypothetical protein